VCDNHEWGSSSRGEEEGDEHGLEPLRNFAEVCAAKKLVRSFFYMPSRCRCNKQYCELHTGGFIWNIKFLSKQLSDCLRRGKYLHGGINVTSSKLNIFVGLNAKCEVLVFSCLWQV
jgi:hypothetical protein